MKLYCTEEVEQVIFWSVSQARNFDYEMPLYSKPCYISLIFLNQLEC